MERGKLLVISGPSGVGKSTAIAGVRARYPEMLFSISVTTRGIRPGEQDGVTYWFKSREEFREMVEKDAFLEHAEYADNCYGTPREPVERCLAEGRDVIMDIDVQGALQVQQRCPDAVLIFLVAPNFQQLEARLRGRGDTSDVEKRLGKAKWEYSQAPKYDYIVVSDTPERTVNDIDSILRAEKLRAARGTELLKLEESL
jgi:guanylate kinase